MKVLICGGTGFIGSNLLKCLSKEKQYELHATYFSRKPKYNKTNIQWHHVDLRDKAEIQKVTHGIDIIIQAAAITSGANDIIHNPFMHISDNAVMNAYLFSEACKNKVKQIIYLSCTIMYPNNTVSKENDIINDTMIHQHYYPAAQTKLYAEKIAKFYAENTDTKFSIIRHSNVYGPFDKYNQRNSHVCAALISKFLNNTTETVEIWGNGEEKRDLLYVDDLVDFCELLIHQQKHPYALYNCGSEQLISIKTLSNLIKKSSNSNKTLVFDESKPTIPISISLNCQKATEEIGWKSKHSLENGLQKSIEWYYENATM